jgi:hypothetical protein
MRLQAASTETGGSIFHDQFFNKKLAVDRAANIGASPTELTAEFLADNFFPCYCRRRG